MKVLPQSNKQRFKNELGVQAPTGFWDPAGFTADGSVEDFKRRRQTELKHGRISMLATMGYITPEHLGKKVKIGYVKQGLSLANKKIFHSAIVRNAWLLVCEVAFCNQEMEPWFASTFLLVICPYVAECCCLIDQGSLASSLVTSVHPQG